MTARVVSHELGEKIRIGKYKRRTGYKKHTGFRSSLTQIEIESIGAGSRKAAARRSRGRRPRAAPRRGRRRAGRSGQQLRRAPRIRRRATRSMTVAQIAEAAPGWRRPNLEAASSTSRRTRSARARSPRSSPRSQRRRATNGAQEGPRLVAQRPRLEPEDARRQDVRRPGRVVRDDPRAPARHAFRPGPGTGIGKDDTIFATRDGIVSFRTSGERRFISVVDRLPTERRPPRSGERGLRSASCCVYGSRWARADSMPGTGTPYLTPKCSTTEPD